MELTKIECGTMRCLIEKVKKHAEEIGKTIGILSIFSPESYDDTYKALVYEV